MNKSELIETIVSDTGLTRAQTESAVDALLYRVTTEIRSGEPVRLTGFGTFRPRNRPARTGRNPQTGGAVRIKATKGMAFSLGATLKTELNARSAPARPKSLIPPVPVKKATSKAAPAKKR